MAKPTELEKLQANLHSAFPIFGAMKRRKAVETLVARKEEPQHIPLLLEVAAGKDAKLARQASAALESLGERQATDALCTLAFQDPTGLAAEIAVAQGYRHSDRTNDAAYLLATRQLDEYIKVLMSSQTEAGIIRTLADAASGNDTELAQRAEGALLALTEPKAKDALCELAKQNADSAAAKICLAKKYRPTDHEQDCLFLFLTRQLDVYFQDNEYGQDEFQTLRMIYDRSEPAVRERVMEIVRSGDNRCLPFVVRPRRSQALSECTDAEIKVAIQTCVRHQDWARLFAVTLELPLKYSFPLLDLFRQSGWEPPAAELKSLYRQILADSQGQRFEPPKEPAATSSVFEKWLAEGRKAEGAQTGEAGLVNKLKEATPPEGVKIVSALAAKPKLTPAALEAVAMSEHWLVRLAGLATGITRDVAKDAGQDSNYWVNELSGAAGVLEFWPAKATPADLEKLRQAPAEAYQGKLGAGRKVLRTILGYRVTDIEVGEVTVVLDGDAAEIVLAD